MELRTRDRRADSSHCVDLHSVQTSFRIILVQFMTFISTNIKIGTWQPCISSLSLLIQISKIVDISYTYIYHLEYQRFKTRKRKTRKFSHFFRFNPATALIFILRTRTIQHLFCIFTLFNPVLTNNRGWETDRSKNWTGTDRPEWVSRHFISKWHRPTLKSTAQSIINWLVGQLGRRVETVKTWSFDNNW